MNRSWTKRYLGDRAFFSKFLVIALPIAIQNGITNLVNMLDNVMVGQLGTAQMNGVSIVNELMLIPFLCLFGTMAGAGIYTAQFYGGGNHEGVKYTFRFKAAACVVLVTAFVLICQWFGRDLILLFLHSENQSDVEMTLQYGMDYLRVELWSLVPFGIGQVYVSTLRETGQTVVPMKAGIAAVFVNISLNYLLIFGKLGFPMLGIKGAALATLCARLAECAVVVIWLHTHGGQYAFAGELLRSAYVPPALCGKILLKCIPLMINESMWAGALTMLNQRYSTRGLDAMAGISIAVTLSGVFNVFFVAVGEATAIMVGQLLGADKKEEARHTDTVLCVYAVLGSALLGVIMAACGPFFPLLYNTTDEVRRLAGYFIVITACLLPVQAAVNAFYFTLRSGGNTLVTFVFDGMFMWCVMVPLAFVLTCFTDMPILPVYLICQSSEIIKVVVGFVLVKKGIWLNNIAQKA